MFTESQLAEWYARNQIPEPTRSVIGRIRSSDPARRVGGGRRNVAGRYSSSKMGLTIQFESHRVELAAVYELEHDHDVLEYYDQPPTFKLEYRSPTGRRLGVLHTADFFVIREMSAGWEECKTQQELLHLSDHNENRYQLVNERWTCPPGETYASALGLYYRVRSSSEIDWIYQRNIQFLEDYLRGNVAVVAAIHEAVVARVGAFPGLSLQDLFDATPGGATRDDIHALIAASAIYADLRRAPLTEPKRVLLYCTDAEAQSSGTKVFQPEGTDVHAMPQSEAEARLRRATESELAIANSRFQHVIAFMKRTSTDDGGTIPKRTLRRWAAAYRHAENTVGSGYLGLLPEAPAGNSMPKLPEQTRVLMNESITSDYETPRQKTKYACWIALKLACERGGIVAPSFTTYRVAVLNRPAFEQTLQRQGHRAAYNREAFYWHLEFKTPPHGDRPFEIGHIDHTELDVESVSSRTGRGLGRTWMTLLTDAFSRRILAVHLTFDPPSYRSCMMVLRECVRRHSRLPQIVVVDGGREFQSTYFETLLARYEITKKTRPAAKPRFGSVCERLFGTANTQFLHNLKGNTQMATRARQMTPAVNPKGQAVWSIEDLHQRLTEYAYDIYDTLDHPALGQSPREAFNGGIETTGKRSHRLIAYDREFLIATLPTTLRGTAKVVPGKGVQIHYLYYWSDLFRTPEVERQRLPVRYDPFDAGTSYAFVNGRWVECHSEHYAIFHCRSEKEVMLASEELRRTRCCHSQQFHVTATKLATFLESVDVHEAVLKQRLADAESLSLRGANPDRPDDETGQASTCKLSPPTGSSTAANRGTEMYGAL